ncbi:MAG: hypothetical protein HW390_1654 [Candidatus Brocadiaceae bacterium]|nr:hypothetical protein [Candidatus Brocadiaceae bacterium]
MWINNPFNGTDTTKSEKNINELISEKDLEVDVVGAKATITPVPYGDKTDSRSSVQIQVNSKDIAQSFSIIAWFPKKYQGFEDDRKKNIKKYQDDYDTYKLRYVDKPWWPLWITHSDKEKLDEIDRKLTHERDRQNPFGEKKLVRVFNGDLRTQIILASEDEVENQFGKEFAKYFFVGRIYLRNQHVDKKLIVYTTSIRAKTMLYREPNEEVASALTDYKVRKQFTSIFQKVFYSSKASQGESLSANEIGYLVNGTVQSLDGKNDTFETIEAKVLENNTALKTVMEDDVKINKARKVIAFTYWKYQMIKDVKDLKDKAAIVTNITDEAVEQFGTVAASSPSLSGGTIQRSSYQIKVNPSPRDLALSADGTKQAEFDAQGFIWEDYYRPMTFQSVLTSLMAVTESSWQRQLVKCLTTAGEVAGGLVGITSIAGTFGNKGYSDAVAFGVGVILPETSKLLLDDLSQHISNLQAASLDTIREVPPNGVVDGYIYFPKGPIFGYGIDEFSVTEPSFIVNIDNTDVQVEATLVEMSYKLESGIKSSSDLTTDALNKGISTGIAEKEALNILQNKVRDARLRILQKALDGTNDTDAKKKLLAEYKAVYGIKGIEELEGIINGKSKSPEELKAIADLKGSVTTYLSKNAPTKDDTLQVKNDIIAQKLTLGDDVTNNLSSMIEAKAISTLGTIVAEYLKNKQISEAEALITVFKADNKNADISNLDNLIKKVYDDDIAKLDYLVTDGKISEAEKFLNNNQHLQIKPEVKVLRNKIAEAKKIESQNKEAIPKDSATEKVKNTPASSEAGKGGGG